MALHPYQVEFVNGAVHAFKEFDRVLGVMATGGGKTVCAAELFRTSPGRMLFLADASILVEQAADKISKWCGEEVGVEMAERHANPGKDRVVVATTQSMCRRLPSYARNHFHLIIVDEAHRNTLGEMSRDVLHWFNTAKVLGMTATPKRSDHKQLGSYYETIGADIGLARLITEGYLTRLRIKSFPLTIDLADKTPKGFDYTDEEAGSIIEPYLEEAARMLAEIAPFRKTVVFLPLIETSKRFAELCKRNGLEAVHVDGGHKEKDSILQRFASGDWDVICNSQLLTTGWDCPLVDCGLILRITRSITLYSQCVGRLTRLNPCKPDAWILDPMFLSDRFPIMGPANLIARDDTHAAGIKEVLESQDELDLLDAVESEREKREAALRRELEKAAKRRSRDVDAVEFLLSIKDIEAAQFEPTMAWHGEAVTEKQRARLQKFGINPETVKNKGHANILITRFIERSRAKLATPKQLHMLTQFKHPNPSGLTMAQASAWLTEKIASRN